MNDLRQLQIQQQIEEARQKYDTEVVQPAIAKLSDHLISQEKEKVYTLFEQLLQQETAEKKQPVFSQREPRESVSGNASSQTDDSQIQGLKEAFSSLEARMGRIETLIQSSSQALRRDSEEEDQLDENVKRAILEEVKGSPYEDDVRKALKVS